MKKKALFEDEGEDGGAGVRVNTAYAQRFEHNKRREELQRLQSKLGDQALSGSSDDESEVRRKEFCRR